MTHQPAHEVVEQHGGTATTHVSKQTTMLVVGEEAGRWNRTAIRRSSCSKSRSGSKRGFPSA